MKGGRCSRQTPEPTFKANDGVAPMQLHCAGSAVWSGDVLTLDLARAWRAASRVTAGWRHSRLQRRAAAAHYDDHKHSRGKGMKPATYKSRRSAFAVAPARCVLVSGKNRRLLRAMLGPSYAPFATPAADLIVIGLSYRTARTVALRPLLFEESIWLQLRQSRRRCGRSSSGHEAEGAARCRAAETSRGS